LRASFQPSVDAVALNLDTRDQPLHAGAVEHSQAYQTRLHIHKVASFATLPLFGSELFLGESLYNSSNTGVKAAHIAVGTSIIGLFGLNTVTGLWNLLGEDRKDPNGRTLRFAHAILMLASEGGFALTAATGPNERSFTFATDKSTHRAIAFTSIGLGTAGYLLMLLHR
jgi:hypothetical protein